MFDGIAVLLGAIAVLLASLGLAAKGETLLGAGIFVLGLAGIVASIGLDPTENLFGGLGLLVLAGSVALIGIAVAVDGKALDTFAAVIIGGAALIIGLESIASAVRNASSGSVLAGMTGTALGIAIIGLGVTGVLTRFRSGDLRLEMSPKRSDDRPPATVHQQPGTLVRPMGAAGLTRVNRERVNELRVLLDDRDATITSTQEMVTKLARQVRDHEVHRSADKELIERLNVESTSLVQKLAEAEVATTEARRDAEESQRAAARLRDMAPELTRLQDAVAQAHKELSATKKSRDIAATAHEESETKLSRVSTLLESRTEELRDQQQMVAAAEQQLVERSDEITALRAVRARIEQEHDALIGERDRLATALAQSTAELTKLNAARHGLETAISDAAVRVKFRDSEIRDLHHAREQILVEKERLAADLAEARAANCVVVTKLTERENDLERIVVRAVRAEADVDELKATAVLRAGEVNKLRDRMEDARTDLASASGYKRELEILTEHFFEKQSELAQRDVEVAEFQELARRYAARTEALERDLVKSRLDVDQRIAAAFDSGSALGERAALEGAAKDERIEQLEHELARWTERSTSQ